MTVIVATPKESEVRKEIRAVKEAAQKVSASKGAARDFLLKNGFITNDNKLDKRYG